LVPLDMWVRLRKELEKIRPVALIAQSNQPEHHLEAFDATYSNDGGIPGFEREDPPVDLAQMLAGERANFPKGSSRLRFSRVASDYPQAETPQSTDALFNKTKTVLAYTLPGVPVSVFRNRWIQSKSSDATNQQFHKSLAALRKEYAAAFESEISELKLSDRTTLVAFEQKTHDSRILVLLNYSIGSQKVLLQIPGSFQGSFWDFFSAKMLTPKNNQLELQIAPFDAKIVIRTAEGNTL